MGRLPQFRTRTHPPQLRSTSLKGILRNFGVAFEGDYEYFVDPKEQTLMCQVAMNVKLLPTIIFNHIYDEIRTAINLVLALSFSSSLFSYRPTSSNFNLNSQYSEKNRL